jgi:hypothetical protein
MRGEPLSVGGKVEPGNGNLLVEKFNDLIRN